jgi:N-methylhydantoinase B
MLVVCGGGGYGDAIERDTALVADDVLNDYVSAAAALDVYGVALHADGTVDEAATDKRRQEIREERRAWESASARFSLPAQPPSAPATGEPPRAVHEYVVAKDDGAHRVLACAKCDTVLADYHGDYKAGLSVSEASVEIIPRGGNPRDFLDEDMVLRRYCCPACQTLMTCEVARRSEPILQEIRFL